VHSRRLALGTAQFGMRYGVANRVGQVQLSEVRRILERARAAGMDTLDTAAAYGASETLLGSVGVADWIIVTKLPAVPSACQDAHAWMRSAAEGSLRHLGLERLGALLLHAPMQLLGPNGAAIYAALERLRAAGLTQRIGVSVYAPEELEALAPRFDFDVVQAPLNILDRRLAASGWLDRLHAAGVEVHVRSLFLQGLLLMPAGERPDEFSRWQPLWDLWHGWLAVSGLTAIQACVAFAAAQPHVDRAVVGVDSLRQLEEILAALSRDGIEPPPELASDEPDLVDPSRWRLRGVA
jgi:aryl-alcohol dehydrogenase-like predicted oxidoreductase